MKKVLVVLIASIFAVTSLFAGGGEYYERPLAYFNENVYEELDISSIINCYNALETDYKQKGMYETYTLISDQFKTGDFGRMFINQKEAIEKFNQSFRSFNIYFNDFPAYDFLIEYKDDSKEDLKGKNLKLPEKQIAPDKNPIAPKINPSKMKAVGKRELTPIQNKKEPGLGLRTEVVNGITIRIDFLESEKYKTIRAVLEDSIKAFQAKTGAKNFSTFPKDGLALDPTTYEIYLNLVDNKGKVIEKDIGPINASKPFFYATIIKTDDINKNGYKFVCNKVNFKRPNNYKESFFVNNGYKYFMANKIKIVKPGEKLKLEVKMNSS